MCIEVSGLTAVTTVVMSMKESKADKLPRSKFEGRVGVVQVGAPLSKKKASFIQGVVHALTIAQSPFRCKKVTNCPQISFSLAPNPGLLYLLIQGSQWVDSLQIHILSRDNLCFHC